MPRLIIDYPAGMTTLDAVDYARAVVKEGKISVAADVPHFCWRTRFLGGGIMVVTRRKKKGQTSDSFLVYREEKAKNHG